MKEYIPILICFCAVFVLAIAVKKLVQRGRKAKYDERQIAAQGQAYKAAYFVLIVYLLAYGLAELFADIPWLTAWNAVMVGLMISVTVFAIICIVGDAYFRSADSPLPSIIAFLAVGVLDGFVGLRSLLRGSGDDQWSLLFAGLAFIVIAVTALVKRAADRRKYDEES